VAKPPPDKEEGTEPDIAVANPAYIGTPKAERMWERGGGGSGGGGDFLGFLDGRVTHLEQRMASVDTKLDSIIQTLGRLPERSEMRQLLLVALALFVAVMAMFIGGMGWLETRAGRVQTAAPSPPQPIVIQVPQQQPAPVQMSRPSK
jgi:hypothetical protein